jgi:hypothetical protein
MDNTIFDSIFGTSTGDINYKLLYGLYLKHSKDVPKNVREKMYELDIKQKENRAKLELLKKTANITEPKKETDNANMNALGGAKKQGGKVVIDFRSSKT